ncbi:hypothetical protein [Acidiferrobacter sp. SPIII_3]|uniref:hypothetical protein n=1 Tax=Acidiferrobacter sp. SPIII_3 TaxID=1281578 RepID=UPI00143D74A5|nr:hypothetical protein [Acidiferrobacter sp. SPIII_3]
MRDNRSALCALIALYEEVRPVRDEIFRLRGASPLAQTLMYRGQGTDLLCYCGSHESV